LRRYLEKITSEVKITSGITYAVAPGYDETHEEISLLLDVYEPILDTENKRRAILFVHGGGFTGGSRAKGYPVTICRQLALYGYVCFSIDYRLFPSPGLPYAEAAPVTVADIESAYRFIVANAEGFGIDPTKLIIGGGSAGAMASLEACRIHPHDYRAFLCLWGTYEGAVIPDVFPPSIFIHGTADQTIPYACCQTFWKGLSEKGIRTAFVTLENGRHTAISRLPEFEESMVRFLYESI